MLVILSKSNGLPQIDDMVPHQMYMPTNESFVGCVYMRDGSGKVIKFKSETDCPDGVDPKVYDHIGYLYNRTRDLLSVIDDVIEESGKFTTREISEAWKRKFDPDDDVLRVRSRFVPLLKNMITERMLVVAGNVSGRRGYSAHLYVKGHDYEDIKCLL